MNVYQTEYLSLKAKMDALEKAEKWEELEEIEDQFLDAKSKLIKWSIDQAEMNGLPTSEADYLRKNWTSQVDKMVNLALKLAV